MAMAWSARRALARAADCGSTAALLTLVVVAGRLAALNAASIGFVLLLAVLLLAVWRGLFAALLGSLLATVAFNYFFLPPVGTLTVADPANWVALGCFLAASVAGSRLINVLRHRTSLAAAREAELQTLYDLSLILVTARPEPGALREALARAIGRLGARAGAVLVESATGAPETLAAQGGVTTPAADDLRRGLAGDQVRHGRAAGRCDAVVPLRAGTTVLGVLVLDDTTATAPLLSSAGRLLGLAVERERLLAEAARAETLRQSDALRAAVLRAVSHDLRSPLTAMGLAIQRLRRETPAADVAVLERERSRLARRIDNLLSLARLEGGLARPHPEPTPPGDLVHAAREALGMALAGHDLVVQVARGCPELDVDPALALEIVVNLLENAARLAPESSPIEIRIAPLGDGSRVTLDVIDRGPGVPPALRERYAVPAPAAAAPGALGLGLEIARGLATANRGELVLLPRPGGGTLARLTLPAGAAAEAVEAASTEERRP